MYFDSEYCEHENTLLNNYKRLKMILIYFKKMFYDEVKKTDNHPILKINNIVLINEDKPRIKWRKGKIIKLLYGMII